RLRNKSKMFFAPAIAFLFFPKEHSSAKTASVHFNLVRSKPQWILALRSFLFRSPVPATFCATAHFFQIRAMSQSHFLRRFIRGPQEILKLRIGKSSCACATQVAKRSRVSPENRCCNAT